MVETAGVAAGAAFTALKVDERVSATSARSPAAVICATATTERRRRAKRMLIVPALYFAFAAERREV
jgi:hypothetical protein